ncbi:MAG: hypothetical protein P1P88_05305 [Bacteroidales bacterium]|nr:hypothetical protein [Bacteroidales bacterium]
MNKQLNLFGEAEIQAENKLIISKKGKAQLSKNQILFNKLTKRIENLEQSIDKETEKCEALLKFHGAKIQPALVKTANLRFDLAMSLADVSYQYKFGKNQLAKINDTILDLCTKAFQFIIPSPEQEAFYNNWSQTSYKEELEYQEKETKETVFDFLNFMFGMDIDPDTPMDTDEDINNLYQKMGEQFGGFEEPRERKKTKKQLQREELAKAEEAIQKKSIRSIYITLAKVLHPDTEKDPVLKLEKEELMKKVTVAFEEKDLTTLLKLEMEWVHKETEHLETLSDDKLKIYISALKQQVAELEQKKYSISQNPRYSDIVPFLSYSETHARTYINEGVKHEKQSCDSLKHFLTEFKKPGKKKVIMEFVTEYCELLDDYYEDPFDF